MDPRIGIVTGILSGIAAFSGTLLVFYCSVIANFRDPHDLTTSIEVIEKNFDTPDQLKLTATISASAVTVGDPFDVEFRLHNESGRRIYLPNLYFFMCRKRSRGGHRPSCIVEIQDEEGRIQKYVAPGVMCGTHDPLRPESFSGLDVGESRVITHNMAGWRPGAPGVYTYRMALDTRGEIPDCWSYEGEVVDPNVLSMLRTLPQGFFVSNPVTVIVEP